MTTFSIITVTYNSADTLAITIESILKQTYLRVIQPSDKIKRAAESSKRPNVEWILIDGASQDATIAVANVYQDQLRKLGVTVRILSEKDSGIYNAMNKGVHLAMGSVIGFLNSGDWYEDNALELIDQTFQNSQCDLTFGDIRIHRQNGRTILKKAKLSWFQTSRNWNHPSTFVKATILKEHPFLEKGIHDDYGFYLYVRKSDYPITLTNAVIANFRMGGASNKKSLRDARKRIVDRYRYCYRINGYSRLYILECVLIEVMKSLL
ncbi:MAG: glycosyltransferase [Clostridium sp.]|jgi:glycosyltransferase involved in cell wall biosynthesis|nr:glycosyltransferase [Clostridium sp.]